MPGYYIRNASGLAAVRDWYIRVTTPPTSSHTMAAAAQGNNRGYSLNATGGDSYGGMTPIATGALELRGLVWANGSTGNPTIAYFAFPASTPIPADDDTTFATLAVTGVFQDSSGGVVTRTLTRSARSATSTNATPGSRGFQFDGALAAQFITGVIYTLDITRTGAAGSSITKVREAYIRTASGIQKYWPEFATSTMSMTAGMPASTDRFGFQNTQLASPFGTLIPGAIGATNIQQLFFLGIGGQNQVTFSHASVIPADTDATWKRIEATGIFNDSGGLVVTRTLTRSAATSGSTGSGSGYVSRTWLFSGAPAVFVNGNNYVVNFFRT